MIEAFSLKTAHLFGDALASQARLRYRVFVQQRALPHPFYDGMEYDPERRAALESSGRP